MIGKNQLLYAGLGLMDPNNPFGSAIQGLVAGRQADEERKRQQAAQAAYQASITNLSGNRGSVASSPPSGPATASPVSLTGGLLGSGVASLPNPTPTQNRLMADIIRRRIDRGAPSVQPGQFPTDSIAIEQPAAQTTPSGVDPNYRPSGMQVSVPASPAAMALPVPVPSAPASPLLTQQEAQWLVTVDPATGNRYIANKMAQASKPANDPLAKFRAYESLSPQQRDLFDRLEGRDEAKDPLAKFRAWDQLSAEDKRDYASYAAANRPPGTNISIGDERVKLPTPPAGYMWRLNPDGTPLIGADGMPGLAPLSGGPVEAEQKEAEAKAEGRRSTKERQSNLILDEIGRAQTLIRDNPNLVTGFGGALLQDLPAGPARELKNNLDTLRNVTAFNSLQEMRDNSKTGGAVGQLSNDERRALGSVWGALDQASKPEVLLYELDRLRGVTLDIVHGADYWRDTDSGLELLIDGEWVSGQEPLGAPKELTYNPETGELE